MATAAKGAGQMVLFFIIGYPRGLGGRYQTFHTTTAAARMKQKAL
ncbi:hypothetical protein [Paenibacillus sp. VTT E-133280]|nr:hypothetical protein [Paenibacillus sp. VTT E-133280]